MQVISNSFHSGRKDNRIGTLNKLASVQKHNSRGYFSASYDASKIHNLIGNADTLVKDTTKYINQKFQKSIDEYNKTQTRKNRKIDKSATEYFADNKNLDIANEIIFQLGDKEFWSKFREDTPVKTSTGKVYVKKKFDEHTKEVMDHLFLRQAHAYENIYKTHKTEILQKMYAAKEKAENYMSNVAENRKAQYLYLTEMPEKKRISSVKRLTEKEQEDFAEFFEQYNILDNLQRKKLIERTEADEMEIKLMSLAGHYDEYDPHGHGVSVCSTKGYESGLEARVAKAVVLNKYSLEVIQERLHEIAREEMLQHPELFREATLKEKEKGRNFDYSVMEYKTAMIREELNELNRVVSDVKEKLGELLDEAESKEKELQEAKEQNRRIKEAFLHTYQVGLRQKEECEVNAKKIKEQEERLKELMTAEEYLSKAKSTTTALKGLQSLIKDVVDRKGLMRDKEAEKRLSEAFEGLSFVDTLAKLKSFEIANKIPEDEKVSVPLEKLKKSLDNQVDTAKLAVKTRQSLMHEHQQQKNKKHEEYGE